MKQLLAFCLVALCNVATGQTSGPITITAAPLFDSIISCTMKDDRHVDKCTLAEGHTLDEVMQAVMDMNKETSDAWNAEIKAADARTDKCVSIAEDELKSLRGCSRDLDKLVKIIRALPEAK